MTDVKIDFLSKVFAFIFSKGRKFKEYYFVRASDYKLSTITRVYNKTNQNHKEISKMPKIAEVN